MRLRLMSMVGIVAIVAGWLWGAVFPINKSLWTSSYVLLTSGFAVLFYGIFYWLAEVRQWRAGLKAFEIFGRNAMAAFILHVVFLKTQVFLFVKNSSGELISLRSFLTTHLFGWTSPQNASLYYGLFSVMFWLAVVSLLYHRSNASKPNLLLLKNNQRA